MREELLNKFYYIFVDNRLDVEETKIFDEITEYIEKLTKSEQEVDDIAGKLCDIERFAFLNGCKMIIDFIGGKGFVNERIEDIK